LRQFTVSDASWLLYGANPAPGIVGVEPAGPNEVHIYERLANGATIRRTEAFQPWLALASTSALPPRHREIRILDGSLPLDRLVTFRTRNEFLDATDLFSNDDTRVLALRSPISQYLVISGSTKFKGMQIAEHRRMQLDI
jgi:hypothetical protein